MQTAFNRLPATAEDAQDAAEKTIFGLGVLGGTALDATNAQNCFLLSMSSVTGPSLTSETCIRA
jgi:hypothetical protein